MSNQSNRIRVIVLLLIFKTIFMKPAIKSHTLKKTLALVALILLFSFSATQAQKSDQQVPYQTLFGSNASHGGYGSFSAGYTQIAGSHAFISGFKGAWVIGHGLALGIAGNGFAADMNNILIPSNNYQLITGGYGGLMIEPIIFPMRPVHLAIPLIIGAGAVGFESGEYNPSYYHTYPYNMEPYFVFEPGVEIELNITHFFRIGVGGSYRLTSNVELIYTDQNDVVHQIVSKKDLNGYNAYLSFKFGRF